MTKLPAPFNLSAVTAARCHPNRTNLSNYLALFVRGILHWVKNSDVFAFFAISFKYLLFIFLPYDCVGRIDLGTLLSNLSPVKAFNDGVSGSEWCRSWDVLFPYLRLGHYVRLGGQDRSRVTVSKVT